MGISIWQLLIILAIVLLLFGTRRLKSIGSDLGGAIKGFKQAMHEGENEAAESGKKDDEPQGRIIDAEATRHDKDKV